MVLRTSIRAAAVVAVVSAAAVVCGGEPTTQPSPANGPVVVAPVVVTVNPMAGATTQPGNVQQNGPAVIIRNVGPQDLPPIRNVGSGNLLPGTTTRPAMLGEGIAPPSTRPAVAMAMTARPSTRPAFAANIAPQLDQVRDAYLKLKSLSLTGTIDTSAEIGGESVSRHAEFTGVFNAPLGFRHEVKGDVVAAVNGPKLFIYLPEENVFTAEDAPKTRGRVDDLPGDLSTLLKTQDLSLALALSAEPDNDLLAGATSAAAANDVTIDGHACPAISLVFPDQDMTVAFDGKTHLIRRVTLDQVRGMRSRGADVKSSLTTINFTSSVADGVVKPEIIAFTPPPTAQEQKAAPAASDAEALAGKPAPHFRLKQVDGTEITDAKMHGSVYILDFWATWCGPCCESLPHLDDIYKKNQAAGLKVFAVNQSEDAPTVTEFIGRTGLSIPVLLDTDSAVGQGFGASAIPETVVIGRDGRVRKVFIGSGNEEGIAAEVAAALKAPQR